MLKPLLLVYVLVILSAVIDAFSIISRLKSHAPYSPITKKINERSRGKLEMKQIVLFGPHCLRVKDNPLLNFAEADVRQSPVLALYVRDPALSYCLSAETDAAVKTLQKNIAKAGGRLYVFEGETFATVSQILNSEAFLENEAGAVSVVTSEPSVEPFRKAHLQLVDALQEKWTNITTHVVVDHLFTKAAEVSDFRVYATQYNRITQNIPLPQMSYSETLRFVADADFHDIEASSLGSSVETDSMDDVRESAATVLAGEDLALSYLQEYIALGEEAFSSKYESSYIEAMARSTEHLQSLGRLAGSTAAVTYVSGRISSVAARPSQEGSSSSSSRSRNSFFRGEVLSGLLSPLIERGCVSPRLLVHSRRVLAPSPLQGFGFGGLLQCRLRDEAVRKDWHAHIASSFQQQQQQLATPQSTVSTTSRVDSDSDSYNDRDRGLAAEEFNWSYSFRSWRGYTQREAEMMPAVMHHIDESSSCSSSNGSNSNSNLSGKPILVLVHGFGGSLDQFTDMAKLLASQFQVFALDSLGFGFCEKPPLSYNQYLWRDQVVEFIERIAAERAATDDAADIPVFVGGNSIGGFTATSVAAELALKYPQQSQQLQQSQKSSDGDGSGIESVGHPRRHRIRCAGLILFNPSGQVLDNTTTDTATAATTAATTAKTATATTATAAAADGSIDADDSFPAVKAIKTIMDDEQAQLKATDSTSISTAGGSATVSPQFPPYTGPPSELLRLFGRTVFALLQPRITQTCEWLYPSNPGHVQQSGLDQRILRDSCDPGAPDVIAAGGKLPKPCTVNQLLAAYRGPVLLAQGALDPLNDAPARASLYGKVRDGVTVDLLPLGHCPMDENGALVAESVLKWAKTVL